MARTGDGGDPSGGGAALAPTWADTDWLQILLLYDALLGHLPSPVIRLHRAIAVNAGFNALFTHRIRIAAITDVDGQLVRWLRHAYDQAA